MIAVGFAAGKLKLAGSVPDGLAEHHLPTSQETGYPYPGSPFARGFFWGGLDRPLSPRSIKSHLSVINLNEGLG